MELLGRYLEEPIRSDLERKMVFVSGARQVGKTTLARQIARDDAGYLNWDVPEDRERILRGQVPPTRVVIFDEIHKYRQWRSFLKGLVDRVRPDPQHILVTGSGRLDLYRRGGDSLQGRYHHWRLWPFSLAELGLASAEGLRSLLELGGFPEPLLSGSEQQARRWSREYRTRMIREDVVDLERIQDLGTLELMALRLPELVGSPLSVNGLREDLQVSHKTVASWLDALERLYAVFRVPPFGAPGLRALRKAQKCYLLDWTQVLEPGPRFENLVAVHLAKWVSYRQDREGAEVELRHFRDVDGREVDFLLVERRQPRLMVECKWGDGEIGRGLRYLKARFPEAEAWQITASGSKDYETPEGIRVSPAWNLLKTWV